ncbi:MAG: hypothetical protein KJO99_05570 [Nitrosopumilus sp.]|nr:hypothetical protein [Nitrosopumilus sp.]NNL53462.1 hypothetical protein [Nitrosopumilus sp.]NNM02815.1 hypothetical protein [Nitrosopumilus sp.]
MTRKFQSFKNARKYVHSLQLKNEREWILFCKSKKKPIDIPSVPRQYYTKEWKGLGDWLGTYTIAPQNKKFRSFKKARQYARQLKLKSHLAWVKYYKTYSLPSDIPTTPNRTYKNVGWLGWNDWLGTKKGN